MRKVQRNTAIIGWMAFLMAIPAEGLFFSLFDPTLLAQAGGYDLSAIGAYSVGFFCFWGGFAAAGLLAVRAVRIPLRAATGINA